MILSILLTLDTQEECVSGNDKLCIEECYKLRQVL